MRRATAGTYLSSRPRTGPELRARLELVAVVAQHLNVAVYVLPAEGERAHMVDVHPVCGEVAQAPVAPGRAPFLHSPAEPRSSVPTGRPSPTPCSSGRTFGRPSYAPWCVLQRPRWARARCSRYSACAPPWWVVVVCPPRDSNSGTLRSAYGSPRGGRFRAPLAVGSVGVRCPRRLVPVRTRWGDHTSLQPRSAPPVKGWLLMGGAVPARCLTTPAATRATGVRGARATLRERGYSVRRCLPRVGAR